MTAKTSRPSALVYVQHLLGIGHLARISRVAEGLAEAGVAVTIAQGGSPGAFPAPAGVEIVQLPPAKVESGAMSVLLHADGRPFDEADRADRQARLLDIFERLRPDILIVEAFPFGRRPMRFELLPLLERARSIGTPLVACSIRDILQESRKPGRAEETADTVERYIDIVLVHGDEAVTPLSLTFPLADRIAGRLRYTGLVGPKEMAPARERHDVIVSAGGGAVGMRLLRAAIGAKPRSVFADGRWLVLAGPNLPDAEWAMLRAAAEPDPGIDLRRNVPDLPARLQIAHLSVSQAGYNTVAEVLAAGCPAVLAPFAAGGETEQALRAAALARAGRAVAVEEAALTPERLADAIVAAAALPRAAPHRLDGARRTAAILLTALAERYDRVPYEGSRAVA
jgi:predicted glycosyltransferase